MEKHSRLRDAAAHITPPVCEPWIFVSPVSLMLLACLQSHPGLVIQTQCNVYNPKQGEFIYSQLVQWHVVLLHNTRYSCKKGHVLLRNQTRWTRWRLEGAAATARKYVNVIT